MNVARIQVAEGSPEGANSAYLLPDARLVVDPGHPGDDAWTSLRSGIEAVGLALSDVARVFLTHWHVDHVGLAVRLAEAASATVHAHAGDAQLVGDYAAERRRRLDRDADRLAEWGVPAAVRKRIRDADLPSPLPDAYPVESVRDGDRLAGLDVLHTPGHTLGHAALADPSSGDLLAGDALLPTYTPNVGGGDTRLEDPLADYLGTLDRIASLEWTNVAEDSVTVYPGHGTRIDFPDRLEAIRDHHRERSARVVQAVDSAGSGAPVTPWAIATALFGDLAGIHAKMGAGEAAAHLTHLRRRGTVELVGENPRRYVAV